MSDEDRDKFFGGPFNSVHGVASERSSGFRRLNVSNLMQDEKNSDGADDIRSRFVIDCNAGHVLVRPKPVTAEAS